MIVDHIRSIGDTLQIVNPIVVSMIVPNREHFVVTYAQIAAITGICKHVGVKTHFKGSERPDKGGWRGMPSGHTTSAWSAASYMRVYSPGHIMIIPLYASATFTGMSRIMARKHTVNQVLAAAVISETIVWLNSKLKYGKVKIDFAPRYLGVGIQISL